VEHRASRLIVRLGTAVPIAAAIIQVTLVAQDRLKTMPGYEQYQKMNGELQRAVRPGNLTVTWKDASTFEYPRDGKQYRFDIATKSAAEVGPAPEAAGRGGRGAGGVARGRQVPTADSPDGKYRAVYKDADRDMYLVDVASGAETRITSDGSLEKRVKYGTASWVYGEELNQVTAMWWSPDSTKLAYYRFDEKDVPDYFLQLDQTQIQSKVDTEAYPKAGAPNPVVDLFIYDVATKRSTKVDVRNGKPFENGVVGHYVYRIAWSSDGRELLFNRTNRRQNVLELAAASPDTGETRVVLREEWPTGWVENSPAMYFLKDGRRFVWESERNGWSNLYLYDLSGKLLTPLTTHTSFEVGSVIKIDEQAGVIFYTARDGDNFLKLQLHRVGLDGKGDRRLTDPAFHHAIGACVPGGGGRGGAGSCGISPDNRYVVDVYQTHDTPPATRLLDAANGAVVAELAKSDTTRFNELGLKKTELFTYKAADGKTTLYGMIQFPSNFNPARKYPALASVYGGPASAASRETYTGSSALAEYGFLILTLDSRAAPGRGKRVLDEIYLKLGQVEMDDMAEGIKALWSRPYFDKTRVGIYGTSYGGYSAVMSLLRHPDVFAAASSSSPVTSWYHYDSIYTERYMWIPQENKEGYEAGNAMNYVKNLKGRLMLYYGTADNNVHPANMMQLISALQREGKSFDVQVGPDRGHSGINTERMMEFFIDALVLKPGSAAATY
jgi:dipeptidyl-peptidase-4